MDASSCEGQVIELLAGGLYRVQIDTGREILCYLSGKMKINRIRVLLGDRVDIIIDPYGGTATNRIIRRKPMK